MQTLNVGAGLSDSDYKAAEEQRRADLVSDSRRCANLFFWAAGCAALGTGLLPIRIGFLVAIGTFDVLAIYGRSLGPMQGLTLLVLAALWVGALVVLGLAARKGHRWAFWVGLVVYGLDLIPLGLTLSMWALGLHCFFLFKWFEGQKALFEARPSKEPTKVSTAAA